MTTPKRGSLDFILLSLLAGCPTGASEYDLVTRHDVAPRTIYRLVASGLIRPTTQPIGPPWDWQIIWLHITDAGSAALQRSREVQR